MAKHKYIETPEKLLDLFDEYVIDVKSNPRLKHVFVGKDGSSESEKLERPLTMEGFEVFCFKKYSDVHHYFDNTDKRYDEYRTICTHIRREIRRDQVEGGMVGQYNASITQHLNNLKEQTEATVTNIEQPLFNDVPKDNSNK